MAHKTTVLLAVLLLAIVNVDSASGHSACTQQGQNFFGDDHANNCTGNSNANQMVGRGAADVLAGAGGNDTISGDDGADTLKGEAGNDFISGLSGSDNLLGGNGADVLTDTTSNDSDEFCDGGGIRHHQHERRTRGRRVVSVR